MVAAQQLVEARYYVMLCKAGLLASPDHVTCFRSLHLEERHSRLRVNKDCMGSPWLERAGSLFSSPLLRLPKTVLVRPASMTSVNQFSNMCHI
jgi:hypothetical protein